MNPEVESFFQEANKWQQEFKQLRAIALDCQLSEVLKWRSPCYTLGKSNIVILQGFKDYCALMFFKGALLKDPEDVLIPPGNSQAARQVRFTDAAEIAAMEPVLKAYIREAIELEKAGLKVDLKKTKDFPIPEELQSKLDVDPSLKSAFEALTPGRQRAYLHYFSGAKRSETRLSRIEKYRGHIINGKGLNDE